MIRNSFIRFVSFAMVAGMVHLSSSAAVVEGSSKEPVSLGKSQVKKILGGKRFYCVYRAGYCLGNEADWFFEPGWSKVKFNKSLSQLTFKSLTYGYEDKLPIRPETKGIALLFTGPDGTAEAWHFLLSEHRKKFFYLETGEGYAKCFSSKPASKRELKSLEKLDQGFSESMLSEKSFYSVNLSTLERQRYTFKNSMVEIASVETEEGLSATLELPYRIKDGVVQVVESQEYYLREDMGDYLELGMPLPEKKFLDQTAWFKEVYGRGVKAFSDSALKLAKFLVKKGFDGYRFTSDGQVIGEKIQGEWKAYKNTLIFSLPKGERLEFYTLKLRGGKLWIREGGIQKSILRFYTDQKKRDAFWQTLREGDQEICLEDLRGKSLYGNFEEDGYQKIVEVIFDEEGKLLLKSFQSEKGKFRTEKWGSYLLDEERPLITVNDRKGYRTIFRVIEATRKGIVLRSPTGEPVYLYYKRLDALEGKKTPNCFE